jgi:hypothetical protein
MKNRATKNRDSYQLRSMACLAASQVLRDPRARATASQLGEGYRKLADRAGKSEDGAETNDKMGYLPGELPAGD